MFLHEIVEKIHSAVLIDYLTRPYYKPRSHHETTNMHKRIV